MDGEVLQEWLDKIREVQTMLATVEDALENAELSPSQNTGLSIAYDFDVEDVVPNVENARELLNTLLDTMREF